MASVLMEIDEQADWLIKSHSCVKEDWVSGNSICQSEAKQEFW